MPAEIELSRRRSGGHPDCKQADQETGKVREQGKSLAALLDLSGVKIVGIAVLSLELGACSPRILKPSGQVCMVFVTVSSLE